MRARLGKYLLALVAALAAIPACTQILGTYEQGVQSKSGPCTTETEDEDCVKGYGCQGKHCALRCPDSSACGAYQYCSSNLCTPPVGTPCSGSDDYDTCSSLSCETLDINGQKTSGYCTTYPSELQGKACPEGYGMKESYGDCLRLP